MYTIKYIGSPTFAGVSAALFTFILALLAHTDVGSGVDNRSQDLSLESCTGCQPIETTIYDEHIITPPDNILGVF